MIDDPIAEEGDVNAPSGEIEPAEAHQFTPELLVPRTVAVNCWREPGVSAAEDGETVT